MVSRAGQRGTYEEAVLAAVSAFGGEVTPKLKGSGWKEDQLRGPLEGLIRAAGRNLGLDLTLIGEVPLVDLRARLDYGVSVDGALVGYIELKRPGYGADPTTFTGENAAQWQKLRLLPNVLYCDGNEFALYRSGRLVGGIARMKGSILSAGVRLAPVDGALARILHDFLSWQPQPPRSTAQLVRSVAKLCRLLCDEVTEAIALEKAGRRRRVFLEIAEEWRRLLFPETTEEEFIEQFGQTVVFALLLARVEGIAFEGESVHGIALKLGKRHSLMGKALDVLTEESAAVGLSTTLDTLLRVIGAVDWGRLDDGSGDSYLLLYEDFLQIYDRDLRKRTGSYYTPHGIVEAMVRLTEVILERSFGIASGFASPEVVVVDPAMGTGTFLLSVLKRAAATIAEDEGPGALGPQLRQMVGQRLIGFERQIGPYAVADLRMHALLKDYRSAAPKEGLRLLVADTLDNPRAEFNWIPHTYRPLAESRRQANKVKRDERVMVVIGNPPHDAVSRGAGKWIETGDPNVGEPAPLDAFRLAGNGTYESKMTNLYVYFWRWGTWKVFDAHEDAPFGVVAYLTPKAWLKGRAFAGMRRYLRRSADEGWIIDLSPEGQRPDNATRLFPDVAQELCIAVFVRRRDSRGSTPAAVHYLQVHGHRDEKTQRLLTVALDDPQWRDCAGGLTDPFLPEGSDLWESSPQLKDLMPWSSRGVTPGRVWVYAPDKATLRERWRLFLGADGEERRGLLGEARDRTVDTRVVPLPGTTGYDTTPLRTEQREQPEPVEVGYRSFDRQLIIPDHRLMVVGRPDLWAVRGPGQMFTVEQNAHAVVSGPALLFSALIPDMDYFNGRSGCVRPLYRDSRGEMPNVAPGLLDLLSQRLSMAVIPEDFLAYVAAVASHPAYTLRFLDDLKDPGVRIPLSAEADLWREAIRIGRRILWLHSYGERYADPAQGRRAERPRLISNRPQCIDEIPDTVEGMPEALRYDPEAEQLWVGSGCIAPVPRSTREYEVSGMNVLDKWFGYRRRKPAGKRRLELDGVVAQSWSPDWTTQLLELLNVLGLLVQEEPGQRELLDAICAGPLVPVGKLTELGILPVSASERRPIKVRPPNEGDLSQF
ncbi:N-6 DNA Methylase [Streptomyces sp. DvalAA-14]|uniref:type ISP restriction/modification enzyme n=1 Tax=unclassified Streptomyces TaxID=2593676 RepID=UPI00081AFF82|nr:MULTISPECIES: type ISP restriction/modification enzyme [unclassified Streptomyces]MYS22504.1 N-6 DNA methylase [Streptomyces sp. SID4948]SCE17359.1 N-6 DNA Methylase [Streptomyces sp. DvalAA-14]